MAKRGRVRAILQIMGGEKRRFTIAVAALVAASVLLYVPPLVIQATLDAVIESDGEAGSAAALTTAAFGGAEAIRDHLWRPTVAVIGLTVIAGLFTYVRGRYSALATERTVRAVRRRVYDHLQRLPSRYFDAAQTGDLVQRCTSDVETLRTFLGTQVVEIGRALIMLAIPIPLMLMTDVRMTASALVLIPLVVGFSLVYFNRVRGAFKLVDEAEGRMTSAVQENLTGIRVVRAYARQDHERARFAEANQTHRDLHARLYFLMARFWGLSDLICLAQKGIVVALGVVLLLRGELSIGAFYFFLSAVTMFIWPVRMMGRILTDLGKALVAVDRLRDILDEAEEDAADVANALEAWAGDIEFDDVTFAHGEATPALDSVSFSVAPGETLALLGPSGSGKSTIVNLLLRLYDYEQGGSGSIRFGGVELSTLDRRDVRRETAVVLQEPFLYSRSLRENLLVGRPGASEEELIEATATACVHDAIESFEQGYKTLVGERGVTLSGGQRQRVALARALLAEPALLILDDALSAVDAETESLILNALRSRHGAHTTIVIAHRLATLRHADRILVLDQGHVVESGTHDELSRAGGLYSRLWAFQTSLENDNRGDRHEAAGAGSDQTGSGQTGSGRNGGA